MGVGPKRSKDELLTRLIQRSIGLSASSLRGHLGPPLSESSHDERRKCQLESVGAQLRAASRNMLPKAMLKTAFPSKSPWPGSMSIRR